jgi:hypothetical protein
LAGMADPKVIRGQAGGGGGKIDERRIRIADERVVTRVLHHDDEDVIKFVMVAVPIMGGKTERHGWNSECGNDCA